MNEPWPWSAGITDKYIQNYTPEYFQIAADLGPEARVCEIGIWHGHGLKFFQVLFPFGEIVGVDFDEGEAYWPPGVTKIVAEQTDPRLPELLGSETFGLIVDDASHRGYQTGKTFQMLWPLVAPGGYYMIEDWRVNLPDMLEMAGGLLKLLHLQDDECDWIKYQYGLAIVHRRKEPPKLIREPPGYCWPSKQQCQSPFHEGPR